MGIEHIEIREKNFSSLLSSLRDKNQQRRQYDIEPSYGMGVLELFLVANSKNMVCLFRKGAANDEVGCFGGVRRERR